MQLLTQYERGLKQSQRLPQACYCFQGRAVSRLLRSASTAWGDWL